MKRPKISNSANSHNIDICIILPSPGLPSYVWCGLSRLLGERALIVLGLVMEGDPLLFLWPDGLVSSEWLGNGWHYLTIRAYIIKNTDGLMARKLYS